MTNPTEAHMFLVKRILRYLQGTIQCGLTYFADSNTRISAYSDINWAADINTRRSITGYVVFLGLNPIFWLSKKQSSISWSSTEAEYKALANYVVNMCWIWSLLKDLHEFFIGLLALYCDNLSALALSTNPVFHSRIKHLDTDYHFVRERDNKIRISVFIMFPQIIRLLIYSPKDCIVHNLSSIVSISVLDILAEIEGGVITEM